MASNPSDCSGVLLLVPRLRLLVPTMNREFVKKKLRSPVFSGTCDISIYVGGR